MKLHQAELGSPAGLAYDLSFNKYGMRICFLGISQNISSYARRFCRRLSVHHKELLEGVETLDSSVVDAALYGMRGAGLSPLRKREIENILAATTAYEAATEVSAGFRLYHRLFIHANAMVRLLPSGDRVLQIMHRGVRLFTRRYVTN